jgi:hypothetical protein
MQKVNKNGISPFPWIFVFSSQEIAVKNYCSDLKSDEGYRHGEKALAFTYMVMKQREVWPCFYAGLWALFWHSKAKQSKGWSLFAYIQDVSSTISLGQYSALYISLSLSQMCWHACCKSTKNDQYK